MKIYPYKAGSESVRTLKRELGIQALKLEGSKYRHRSGERVINWGNSRPHERVPNEAYINKPSAVAKTVNKLDTFTYLQAANVRAVPSTSSPEQARAWLEDGHKVYVRHSLTGHSGEGIEVLSPVEHTLTAPSPDVLDAIQLIEELREEFEHNAVRRALDAARNMLASEPEEAVRTMETPDIPEAPLYTRGVHNHGEYRVHVFNGEVILYQKKSRRVDEDGNVETPEGEEADVRNLASNWVYRTGNLRRLERVEQLAISAINALGLDFGAVDIVMDEHGDVFVLEVNSAVGLGNTETIEAYVNAFNNIANQ